MLMSLVFCNKEISKFEKLMKMVRRRKSSYLLNDLRNFNEIFRKDVTYDNIKSHKKPGLHPVPEKHIFGKITGGGGVPFVVKSCPEVSISGE